jgi:hypothetical protein
MSKIERHITYLGGVEAIQYTGDNVSEVRLFLSLNTRLLLRSEASGQNFPEGKYDAYLQVLYKGRYVTAPPLEIGDYIMQYKSGAIEVCPERFVKERFERIEQ